MIRIDEIDKVPDFPWGHVTAQELTYGGGAHHALVTLSSVAVAIYENDKPILAAGLLHGSFLGGPPRLWCLITKNFAARHIRLAVDTKRLISHYQKKVVTSICDDPRAKRLARAWGFQPTGVTYTIGGLPVEDYVWEA